MFTIKKVGGLYHWRVGRIGGSFYIARAKVRKSAAKVPAINWQAHIVARLPMFSL